MFNQEFTVGIDLGTTNSSIGFIKDGQPFIIKVDGSYLMPSVLSVGADGSVLVGKPAVNNRLLNPQGTICHIKRKMGLDTTIDFAGGKYTPQMLSSLILKRLKMAAEQFTGKTVKKAVITVPAYFNEQQRKATAEAGEMAGLEVLRLLNEPTAAALSYSLTHKKQGIYLVYDLGGGTFDVSIVDLSSQVMEVRASNGDVHLGGVDFDHLIADKLEKEFAEKNACLLDAIAKVRLETAAENAKIHLSSNLQSVIIEEGIAKNKQGIPLHLNEIVTRPDFEKSLKPFIERTLHNVDIALKEASLTADQLDHVVLVGGSTYIPMVQFMLKEHLGMVPQAWINPSLAVVEGAAIEAANLSGISIGAKMVDIIPHSFGVGICRDDLSYENEILIHRNTPLPTAISHIFYKLYSDTDEVHVEVFQGESTIVEQNELLGELKLDGLKNTGKYEVLVKFEIDRSGLLHVSVIDFGTQKKVEKTLHRTKKETQKSSLEELHAIKLTAAEDFPENGAMGTKESTESKESHMDEKVSLLSDELTARVEALLGKEDLDPQDREEIQKAYKQAQHGDAQDIKQLEELLYFMV